MLTANTPEGLYNLQPVNSSTVEAYGVDLIENILILKFKKSSIAYKYTDEHLAHGFQKAVENGESLGAWISENIRKIEPPYSFEKVEVV